MTSWLPRREPKLLKSFGVTPCSCRYLPAGEVERQCRPDPGGETLLRQAMQRLGLSARAYHRVLRVARTLADLAGAERPGAAQVAEAIQYRRSLDTR